MKTAFVPIGVSLKTPSFTRLNKNDLKYTDDLSLKTYRDIQKATPTRTTPRWVTALVGLAVLGVLVGAPVSILVAMGGGNTNEVSPPPPPEAASGDAASGDAASGEGSGGEAANSEVGIGEAGNDTFPTWYF